jgi:antitoxin ParD1/3/4
MIRRITRGELMSTPNSIERLTVTMPTEMANFIKQAVSEGDYASTSEVIREAVRDWKSKRAMQFQDFAMLKADLDKGLADVAAGKTTEFNPKKIIARAKKLLAERSSSN